MMWTQPKSSFSPLLVGVACAKKNQTDKQKKETKIQRANATAIRVCCKEITIFITRRTTSPRLENIYLYGG